LAGRKVNVSLSLQQLSDHEILPAAEFQHRLQQLDLTIKITGKHKVKSQQSRDALFKKSHNTAREGIKFYTNRHNRHRQTFDTWYLANAAKVYVIQ